MRICTDLTWYGRVASQTASTLLAVHVLMAASSTWAQEGKTPATEANSIRLRVIGPDGNAVKDAEIHVGVWTDEPFKHNQDFLTDGNGQAKSPLPKQIRILRVWANKEHHVPLFAQWWPEMQPDGNEIPKQFTFELQAGTKIGGTVVDEDGNPIEGVRVEAMRASRGFQNELQKHLNVGTWLAEGDSALVTDAHGRWTLTNVPPGDETVVQLKISHPDFIDDANWGGYQAEQGVIMPLLRDGSAVIRMKRGDVVTGSITAREGQAITDAVVVWGDDPYLETGRQEVRSDKQGAFKLPPLPPATRAITVIAKGWAPQRRDVEFGPQTESVDFRLQLGRRLAIHFEDYAGNSIPEVYVGINGWRGAKSLYNHKHPNVLDTLIPRQSDRDGNYAWDWAPEDEVTYSFGKQGYQQIEQRSLTATGETVVVLMQPMLTLRGTVTDAVTGAPVTAFQVAIKPNDRRKVALMANDNQFSKKGNYKIEAEPQNDTYVIRVDAKGYRSFSSPEMTDLDGEVTFDAELEPEDD
jgi:protocatechuate 3,4-dioxygenase beta subunit